MRQRENYRIKEIFGPTIQGEGSHAGVPVKFIRFAGCNRWTGLEKDRSKSVCSFCDTDFRTGQSMTIPMILESLIALGSPKVKTIVISGGEASLQIDTHLLQILRENGFNLHIETNGSRDLTPFYSYLDHITMSPKQSITNTQLKRCDDLKLLYPPIHPDITIDSFSQFQAKARFLQPVWDENYKNHLQMTLDELNLHPEWRLSLQTHKIIGVQ